MAPSRLSSEESRSAEEIQARMELVQEIQNYELRFGFAATDNFKTYNGNLEKYSLCFYAEKFDLEVDHGKEQSDCALDQQRYDVYIKRVEALADIKTPLTRDLVDASIVRFIMVIFHEDFHEQMSGVPTSAINESAATLMGFLLAREFAREKYGDTSVEYLGLADDMDRHVEVSRILEKYAGSLGALYGHVINGETTTEEGLREKEKLFSEMREECTNIVLLTMNSCGNLKNNADFGVAFQYAKHYRLFYGLHKICGGDIKKTALLLSTLAHAQLTEKEYLTRAEGVMAKKLSCAARAP